MSSRIRESIGKGDSLPTIFGMPEGLGRRKRKSVVDRRRETSKNVEATTANDAAVIDAAVVAVAAKDVSKDAKRTLMRLDDGAYVAGCFPKSFLLSLPRTKNGEMRESFVGLRRIGLGRRLRHCEISRQIQDADNLIHAAKQEILVLVGKRAAGAKKKLEIMDELGDSDDPIQTVMSHASGRAALKSLLETLSSSTSSKIIQERLGPSRKLLDFVIKEAWQTRYLTDDSAGSGGARRPEAKVALADPPTIDDRAKAKVAYEVWDVFEKQMRQSSQKTETISPRGNEKGRAMDAAIAKNFLRTANEDAVSEVKDAESLFETARSRYFSYLAQFLPLLERWQPAQDFLWQLRYERLAFQKKSVVILSEHHTSTAEPSRKRLEDAKKYTMRMRAGTRIHGNTDKHGTTRALKDDDEYMNSDVVHGAGFRVRLDVLEPMLRNRISNSTELRFRLRAELAAITQYAFEYAAIHAQRRLRGWLTRSCGKLEDVRGLCFHEAIASAAVMIQSNIRIYLALGEYVYRSFVRATECATLLQCAHRRHVSILEYNERRRELADKAFYSAALISQSLCRCWLAKRERRTRLRAIEIIKAAAGATWAATSISAMGRRYLAKRAAFRRDVELNLNQRLLKLTHRYLATGDMWSFLTAINGDYLRYEAEAEDARRREEHDANTFMRKLCKQRREAEEAAKRAHFVSATARLKSSCKEQRRRQKAANALSLLRSPLRRKAKVLPRGSKLARGEERFPGKGASMATSRAKKDNDQQKSTGDLSSKSTLASRSDIESFEGSGTGLTKAGDDISKLSDCTHPAGLSVLSDIPHSLNDPPVRLLRAAALRTFVPSSFVQGTTSAKAFQSYSLLPPSLVKTNHEIDAYAAVASWEAAFAAAGYRELWELCPPSRLEATMKRLQDYVDPNAARQPSGPLSEAACHHARSSPLPAVVLAPKCRALLTELLAISKETSGRSLGGLVRTAEHFNAYRTQGRITNGQAVMAARMRCVRIRENSSGGVLHREPVVNQIVAFRHIQGTRKSAIPPLSRMEGKHVTKAVEEEESAASFTATSED